VRDEKIGALAARSVGDWMDGVQNWRVVDLIKSPITGGGGNPEYLMAAAKSG